MYNPKSLVNRYFIFAWIIGLTLGVGQATFNSIITVFANSSGYSNTFAGSLSIGYLVGALIGRMVGGWVTDLRGRRSGVVLGTFAFMAATFLFCLPAAKSGLLMMLLRLMHGFGYACATTAYYVMVEDVVPENKASVGLGINFTGQGISFALTGFLISMFVVGDSYTTLFLALGAAVAVAVLFGGAENYEKGRPVVHKKEKDPERKILEPASVPYAVIVLVYYVSLALPMFYIVPLAMHKGIQDWSFLFTCYAIGMVAGYLIFPKIFEKTNSFIAMIPVYLAGIVGLLVFLYTKNDVLFNLMGIPYGATLASVPVMQHAAIQDVPEGRKGNGTATLNSAIDLTMGVGPFIWGILIDGCGFTVPYIIGALLFVAAFIVHAFVERNRSRRLRIQ